MFTLGHTWVYRKADQTLPDFCGDWKLLRGPTVVFGIIRMQVQWTPVNGKTDALPRKRFTELISIERQSFQAQVDREQMPGMQSIRRAGRQHDFIYHAQFLKIPVCDLLPFLAHLLSP